MSEIISVRQHVKKKTIRTDSAAPKSSSPYLWVKVTPVQEVLIHSKTKANKIPADMWESSEM